MKKNPLLKSGRKAWSFLQKHRKIDLLFLLLLGWLIYRQEELISGLKLSMEMLGAWGELMLNALGSIADLFGGSPS